MEEDTDNISLSDLQLAMMQVIWQSPGASIASIAEGLRPERDLAHTTVATLLNRLEKRGVIRSEKDNRQLQYYPTISQKQIKRSMVSNLLATLFKGNPSELLSHLVNETEIDKDALNQMRSLLEHKGNDHES